MGQYFTQPNTALSMPGGPAMAVGNPQQLAQAASSALPSADAMLGPDVLKPNQNAPELPFIRRPSVMEAAEAGARPGSGQGNVFSPGLSKGGKLLTLLTSGLQGALAGRAAQEQAAVQSGGRRAGGVGLGFEAGYAQPFQRQEQAAQAQQQQAQAQLSQAGLQPFETQEGGQIQRPFGNLPAALASRFISPYLGYQGKIGAANIGAQSRQNVAQTGAQAKVQAAEISHRFIPVPGVGLFDAQSQQVLPGTSKAVTITPEMAQDYGLPDDFVGKPMDLGNFASLERANAAFAPTVRTSTDPLGLTTTSVSQKQRPGAPAAGANSGGKINQIPGGGIYRPIGAPARRAQGAPQAGGGGGAAGGGGGGSGVLSSTAQRLVDGQMDPSQLPKRGAAYLKTLQDADTYSMQKYGEHFDVAKAQSDYDYAKNTNTQNTFKYLNSLTGSKGGKGNLDSLISLSDKIDRTQFPALNDVEAWTRLQAGDPQIASYRAAVTEVSDQVAKILQGGGSGSGTSDAKLQQAAGLFSTGFNKEQLKGVAGTLRDLLSNRKREMIGDNRYLQRQYGEGTQQRGNSKVLVEGKDF